MAKFRVMIGYHSHDGDSAYSGLIGKNDRFDSEAEARAYAARELKARENFRATIQRIDAQGNVLEVVEKIEK